MKRNQVKKKKNWIGKEASVMASLNVLDRPINKKYEKRVKTPKVSEPNYTLPELLKACKDVIDAQYDKGSSLARLNGAVSNLRDLIGE